MKSVCILCYPTQINTRVFQWWKKKRELINSTQIEFFRKVDIPNVLFGLRKVSYIKIFIFSCIQNVRKWFSSFDMLKNRFLQHFPLQIIAYIFCTKWKKWNLLVFVRFLLYFIENERFRFFLQWKARVLKSNAVFHVCVFDNCDKRMKFHRYIICFWLWRRLCEQINLRKFFFINNQGWKCFLERKNFTLAKHADKQRQAY